MGRVIVSATVESLWDAWEVERGFRTADQLRRLVLTDAEVEPRALSLCLPTRYIRELGLERCGARRVFADPRSKTGTTYGPVRLTIQGRECVVDVTEVSDSMPPLVGLIVLNSLDFVIDAVNHRLIGDPAHGGEQVYEVFCC